MKKFAVFVLFIFIFLPIAVKAEKASTVVIGSDKVKPGETVVYTVIVDRPLTEYSAEITYDREVLNLISLEEVNINTTTKDFDYKKSDPIIINSKSTNPSNIIYYITFGVKNYFKEDKTEISVKTTLAKSGEEVYEVSDSFTKVNVVEKDELFVDTEKKEEKSELSKTLTSISTVIKEYDNPIMIASVSINVVLLILLIVSLRRKKVDYDF